METRQKRQNLTRIRFQRIGIKETDIEARVSRAFELLFEATAKGIAEKQSMQAVGKTTCFNWGVSHNDS